MGHQLISIDIVYIKTLNIWDSPWCFSHMYVCVCVCIYMLALFTVFELSVLWQGRRKINVDQGKEKLELTVIVRVG